jgi:integrase
MAHRLAGSTVAVIYGRISAAFSAAVRDRIIAPSPCVDVKRPKLSSGVEAVLTTDQVLAIANAILPSYRALVLTMAGTGLRPGEAFGLTVDAAPHDLRRGPGGAPARAGRAAGRRVDVAPQDGLVEAHGPGRGVVIDAVTRHLAEHRPHPVLGLVFTNERGGPLQQSPFARTWGTAPERAGAPGWATPHDLRHYYASLLIHRGASVKTVQRRLGHRSAKTTLDTYAALWPDAEDATRAAVDDELGPRLVSPPCHPL